MTNLVWIIHMPASTLFIENTEAKTKVYEFLKAAVDELNNFEATTEQQKLILNNSLIGITQFFVILFKSKGHKYIDYDMIRLGIHLSFLAKLKSTPKNISSFALNATVRLFENNTDMDLVGRIKNDFASFFQNSHWRIREHALVLQEACCAYNLRDINGENFDFEHTLEFLSDKNIYVQKQARQYLKTTIVYNYEEMMRISSQYMKIAHDQIKELKELKKQKKDTSELRQALTLSVSILLSISTAGKYQLSWNIPLVLFLSKLIPFLPNLKADILKFLRQFKKVHQQLVVFQESKHDAETLENLKEIFAINSDLCMTY